MLYLDSLNTLTIIFSPKKSGASGQSWRRQRPSMSKSLMEHVREKYDFVFNKDKFSLDDYNDSINFGDLPASSPPPSGKILYFIFKHALTYCEKKNVLVIEENF